VEIDVKETKGGYKFSLVLIQDEKRIVGYDNHEGYEPHKHIKGKIYQYEFTNIDKLISDFYEDVSKILGKEV